MERGFLLLEDNPAEKTAWPSLLKRTTAVKALKGELLNIIPDDQLVPRSDGTKPHNYRLVTDETITLRAEEEHVAPLWDHEFLLLEAIESRIDRYQVFSSEKLECGTKLKPGDAVYVSISGRANASSIIRYVGETPNNLGLLFGVEIMDKNYFGYGTTDGTLQGKRYFSCIDDRGLFVALDKIFPDSSPGPITIPPKRGANQQSSHLSSQSKSNTSDARESSTDPQPQFLIGDRVVVYNKKGAAVYGTVRWTGQIQGEVRPFAVGIETDISVRKEDFTDALSFTSQPFRVTNHRHGKVYLLEAFVAPAEQHSPSSSFNTQNPVKLAKTYGFDSTVDMKEQSEAIQQAEGIKEAKELKPLPPAQVWSSQGVSHTHTQPNVPSQMSKPGRVKVSHNLGIGSTVQVSDPPRYGVIRWIGMIQGLQGSFAGIALEEDMEGCEDGTWRGTRYFRCAPGRGFISIYSTLKPDNRRREGFQGEKGQQLRCQDEEVEESRKGTLLKEKEHFEQECSLLRRQLSEQSQAKEHSERECSQLRQQLSQQSQTSQKLQQEYTGLEQQLSQVSEQHQQEKREKLLLQEQWHEEKRHFQEECATLQHQVIQQREVAAQAEVRHHQEIEDLQHRLDTARAEMQQLRPSPRTRVLVQDIDPWTVSRSEVQILSEMGRGAWGYVAKGRFRGQLVAVKSPHPEILDKHTTERLRREVSIMTQVRHPNLLRIVAAVFDNQVPRLPPLIVTELLDMNLRAAYQNNRLSGASRIPIFRDVAYALHYLHEHQEPIIHRDVSTPNVLLEELPNGMFKAKVSDFGSANLAKLAQTLAEGAIIYAAPETFPPRDLHSTSPPPPQTTKIDVYSYGILLCEVITCQLPDPQHLRSMLQEVKRQWTFMHDLIVSCTQHSPEDRLTMAQVLDKLNQLPRAQPRHRS